MGSERRKSLSLVKKQSHSWYGVWCPRSQLSVKMGARVPVPYGVGATVSDILMVNPAGVIDVFSLYTRLTSRLDLLL